jgi:hypothetical protein
MNAKRFDSIMFKTKTDSTPSKARYSRFEGGRLRSGVRPVLQAMVRTLNQEDPRS